MSPRPLPLAALDVRAVSSSTASAAAQPNLSFVFPSLGQQTTCNELFIQWFYNGPKDNTNAIALYITNKSLHLPSGSSSGASVPSTGQPSSGTFGTGTVTSISSSNPNQGTTTTSPPPATTSITTSSPSTQTESPTVTQPTTSTTRTDILTNPVGSGTQDTGLFTIPEGTGTTGRDPTTSRFFTNPVGTLGLLAGKRAQSTDSDSKSRSITVEISRGLPPASGNITWQDITVPPGMYVIAASFPDSEWTYTQRSLPFTVINGTDTSCVGSQPTTILATGTPAPSTGGVGAVADSSMNKGAIAGGVVGALAAIAALIAALLYYRYKRIRHGAALSSGSLAGNGRWSRLGNVGPGSAAFRSERKQRTVRFDESDPKSPSIYGFSNLPPRQETETPGDASFIAPPTFIRPPESTPPPPQDPFVDPPSQSSGEKSLSVAESPANIVFTPTEIGYGYAFPNHSKTSNPLRDSNQSAQIAYPSGGSDALPDEDLAAIWSESEDGGNPSSAPSTLRSHRKPVPAYRDSPGTSVDYDTMDALTFSQGNMAGVGARRMSREPVGQTNMMGKEMHYLVPDLPPNQSGAA